MKKVFSIQYSVFSGFARALLGLLLITEYWILNTSPAPAANLVTSVLTVTNLPQTSNIFYFASASAASQRTWTNQTTANTILTNLGSGLGGAATNLFNALANFPLSGITSISQTNTNVLVFKATSLVVTQGGNWASIVTTTNTGTNVYSFAGPFDSLPPSTRTNEASELVYGLANYPTNPLPTTSLIATNFMPRTNGYGTNQIFDHPIFTNATGSTFNLYGTNSFLERPFFSNPTTTNLVNYGSALRSEGTGANSLQLGSNSLSLGPRSISIGNNATATNTDAFTDAVTLGTGSSSTNGIAIGNSSFAGTSIVLGNSSSGVAGNIVIGNSTTATGSGAINIGGGGDGLAKGLNCITLGSGAQAFTNSDLAIGYYAVAGIATYAFGSSASAFGDESWAKHSFSTAIGAFATTTTNHQVRLGTASEFVSCPGMLEVAGGVSNLTTAAGSTNLINGSLAFPRYDLTTLAAGNNISVPLGTNTYIRLAPGTLASSPTLCGLIGGATAGGENGETKFLFNDTGFSVVLAVNTVDPIPANRISTYNSSDYSLINQGFAQIFYDSVSARWKIAAVWPQTNFTATATNPVIASATGFGTNTTFYQQTVQATNGSFTLSNCLPSRVAMLNAALQLTNEPDATLANLSSLTIKNYTNALTSLRTNSISVGSVTGINYGYGLTGVVASSELRLGVSAAPPSTQMWMGGAGNNLALALGVYRYVQVSGQNGVSPGTTNTTVGQVPAANFTVTGLAFNTSTLTIGTGTNITIAFQTNGVDAFTTTLTGNASRSKAFALGQSIPVTTNDTFNIRFVCDGAVSAQNYSSSVTYTIP